MKKSLIALMLWLAVLPALAQQESVQFSSSVQRTSDTSAVLIIKALLKDSLALFTSQPASADDPLISSIVLDSSSAAMLANGTTVTENGQLQTLPDGSGGSFRVYKDSVEFRLPLRVNAETGNISGKLVWLGMKGDEFPNGEYSFTANIPASGDAASNTGTGTEEEKSMWQIFLKAFWLV